VTRSSRGCGACSPRPRRQAIRSTLAAPLVADLKRAPRNATPPRDARAGELAEMRAWLRESLRDKLGDRESAVRYVARDRVTPKGTPWTSPSPPSLPSFAATFARSWTSVSSERAGDHRRRPRRRARHAARAAAGREGRGAVDASPAEGARGKGLGVWGMCTLFRDMGRSPVGAAVFNCDAARPGEHGAARVSATDSVRER